MEDLSLAAVNNLAIGALNALNVYCAACVGLIVIGLAIGKDARLRALEVWRAGVLQPLLMSGLILWLTSQIARLEFQVASPPLWHAIPFCGAFIVAVLLAKLSYSRWASCSALQSEHSVRCEY